MLPAKNDHIFNFIDNISSNITLEENIMLNEKYFLIISQGYLY